MATVAQWKTKIISTLAASLCGLLIYTYTGLAAEVDSLKRTNAATTLAVSAVDIRLNDHVMSEAERQAALQTELHQLNTKMDTVLQELAAIRGKSITSNDVIRGSGVSKPWYKPPFTGIFTR